MSFSIINSERLRLRPRSYAIAAIAIGFAGLLAVMAANVLIDPQGVFGTGLFVPVVDPNLRYVELKAYEAAPDHYDGFLFSSSRGGAFDGKAVAKRLGVHAVVKFSVQAGQMSDYLPMLEYLLRNRTEGRTHIAAIFLLLDADWFGTQPWTNNNINSFLPPGVGNESRWYFWWRYLTVFQFTNWRRYIARAIASRLSDAGALPSFRPHIVTAALAQAASAQAAAARLPGAVDAADQRTYGPRIRPDLAHQLALFKRFVTLCRDNRIRLVVAFSPLNARSLFAGDAQMAENERVVAMVARIFPVWDFGRPAWLSARPDLWYDSSHFKPAVADMMLKRIFEGEAAAPADFGTLRFAPGAG
jgi:hypothetical protein